MLLDDARDTDSQAVISYYSTMLCRYNCSISVVLTGNADVAR